MMHYCRVTVLGGDWHTFCFGWDRKGWADG